VHDRVDRRLVDGEQELVRRQVAQSGRSQPAVHQGTQRPDGVAVERSDQQNRISASGGVRGR